MSNLYIFMKKQQHERSTVDDKVAQSSNTQQAFDSNEMIVENIANPVQLVIKLVISSSFN